MSAWQSVIETLGVAALAGAGVLLGWWAGRKPWPRWLVGYGVPLVLLILIAVARWVSMIEYAVPFRWFMAGRTEFAVLAFIATALLTSPLARVPRTSMRHEHFVQVWLHEGIVLERTPAHSLSTAQGSR